MINREIQKAQLLFFSPGKDEKGKIRQVVDNDKTILIDVVIKPYQQTVKSDIRFTDTTDIALTQFKNITCQNQIVCNGNTYNVLYAIPSNRYNQVFLKKV